MENKRFLQLRDNVSKKYGKFLKFGIVGGIGTIVNTGLLWILTFIFGFYYLFASVIATEVSIISNFVGNNAFTFKENDDPSPVMAKFAKFQLISLTTIIGTLVLLWFFTTTFGIRYLLIWNMIAILVMFVMNFVLNKKFTWRSKEEVKAVRKKSLFPFFVLVFFMLPLGMINAENETLSIFSTPEGASILINGVDYGITPLENESLVPGDYSVVLTLEGYEDYVENITLGENETAVINATLVELSVVVNATLNFYSNPEAASISIDGENYGMTPLEGTSLEPGNYTVELSLEGYDSYSEIIELTAGQVKELNVELNETLPEVIEVVESNTSLEMQDSLYYMAETESANFSVTLNSVGEVQWYVEDNLIESTNEIENAFTYNPGILSSGGGVQTKVVSALVVETGEEISWNVGIEDVVNPYFDPESGTGGTSIFVYTKNGFFDSEILNVSVEIQSKIYLLSAEVFETETKWIYQIPSSELSEGNNYLTKINLEFENESKSYEIPTLGDIRAFYKNPQNTNSGSSSGGGGGSSGGGSASRDNELVYVVLEKNILGENETQTIKLDARGRVFGVNVTLLSPDGRYLVEELELVEGDLIYGTWEVELMNLEQGLYKLVSVEIAGFSSSSDVSEEVEGRTFYVVSGDAGKNLFLVYTLLEKSEVSESENVSFTLDASDTRGIESVNAKVVKIHAGQESEPFLISLELVEGDAKYGTWEGFIFIDQPDTTFVVEEVTLSNGLESETYEISNRSVYATSSVEDFYGRLETGSSFLTGFSIIGTGNLFQSPRLPVIIGFGVFLAIAILSIFYDKTSKKIKKLIRRRA